MFNFCGDFNRSFYMWSIDNGVIIDRAVSELSYTLCRGTMATVPLLYYTDNPYKPQGMSGSFPFPSPSLFVLFFFFRSSAAWLSLRKSVLAIFIHAEGSFSAGVCQLAISASTTLLLSGFSEVTSQSFFFFQRHEVLYFAIVPCRSSSSFVTSLRS